MVGVILVSTTSTRVKIFPQFCGILFACDQLDIISAEGGEDGFLSANLDKRFRIDAKCAEGAASESDRISIPEFEGDSLAC